MTKKITIISILIISMILVSLYVISSTYSVIINVISKNGESQIIDKLTIRDILTNSNGHYNNLYYNIKRELNITHEEGEILINSVFLNNAFENILNDIVRYRLYNRKRMSNDEIYNLIITSVNNDDSINTTLKNKVIQKTDIFINDIVNYLYEFDVSNIEVSN